MLIRVSKQRGRRIVYFDFSTPLHQRNEAALNVDRSRPYLPKPGDSDLLKEIIAKLSLPINRIARIHSCSTKSLTIYHYANTDWTHIHDQIIQALWQQRISFGVTSTPNDRWLVRYLDQRRWSKM